MITYSISPERKAELQNKARILAAEAADNLSFENSECRYAFMESYIENYIIGYIEGRNERRQEIVKNMQAMGFNEDEIDSILSSVND